MFFPPSFPILSIYLTAGFNLEDGDPLMSLTAAEMISLVDSDVFKVLGYAALRLMEALDNIKEGQHGEIDEMTCEHLEVKKRRWDKGFKTRKSFQSSFFFLSVGR